MREFFFYIIIVAGIIGFGILYILYICFLTLWDRSISPSIKNIRFALFGKPTYENRTYYQLWSGMAKWHYRYYTRGNGNKNFARCAMRRLIRDARKESKRIGPDG